jgi:hypothetical protein
MLALPMKNQTLQTLSALALFAAAMASRLYTAFGGAHVTWLQNFSPLAAICLCGAIYLPRNLAVILPVSIVFISDLVINTHYHVSLFCVEMLSRYIALALVICLGWAVRKQGRLWMVIPAGLLGAVAFYIITNTGSWISDAGYQKNLAGWVQSLTSGLPGYPPAWMFFRNSMAGDLLFTTLFALCMFATSSRAPELKLAGHRAQSAT